MISKKIKKKNIEPCDCVRCLNFVAFNFKFFVSFVKARTNGTENQFEIDKKRKKMIKTDEAEKTNSPQSIFCFSHCYKRMKFKRKKKEKVAQHGHASFKFFQCSAVCISIFRLSNWY